MLSTQAIAAACARHPWRTIAVWAVAIVLALAAIMLLLGGRLTTEGSVSGTPESVRAERVIGEFFPFDPTEIVTDIVVVRSDRHTVEDSQFRRFVEELDRDVGATRAVAGSRTFYRSDDSSLVSTDRHATLVSLFVPDGDQMGKVVAVVESADADSAFRVSVTGEKTVERDFNDLSQQDLKSGELQFGLPAALIILVLVFGALVAGLVPVLLAIVSIVVALGLTAVLSQAFELSVFVVNMLIGMGLALGIDYSLFIVSRYREERSRAHEPLDAIALCGATASRAVLFSGTAFVVAMFGMLLVPTSIMRSLATGAILVGVVSVIAALTLLPAILGLLRDRVNALHIPLIGSPAIDKTDPEGRFWRAVVTRVQRHPAVSLIAAVALLLAAASPIFGLRIGASGVTTLPERFASRQGFIDLQRDFPHATTDPAEIVVTRNASNRQVSDALERLRQQLARDPRFGPGEIRRSAEGQVAVLTVPVAGDSAGEPAVAAVRELRSDLIPSLFAGTDTEVLVAGATAENIEYFDAVSDPAPIVFLFVLGLTLVLLTVVFRSIVVAAVGVVLNLLSVGAAYGLLVLVFEHGVGADLLGFQKADTIEAWVPLFLFSVLFGLSMDYQVFLLSRIRERHLETGETQEAVASGVARTARLITGAALIIIVVFIGFAMGDLIMFQQMGFGVAVALLIDATIVRSVLVPAVMTLLGKWNWYLPGWLSWLPEVHVEGDLRPTKGSA